MEIWLNMLIQDIILVPLKGIPQGQGGKVVNWLETGISASAFVLLFCSDAASTEGINWAARIRT